MKLTPEENKRIKKSVDDSLDAINGAEMTMRNLIDSHNNNKKVHDLLIELEILLKEDASISKISKIVSEISLHDVVFVELFSPHVVAGDLTVEYGLKSNLRTAQIDSMISAKKKETVF